MSENIKGYFPYILTISIIAILYYKICGYGFIWDDYNQIVNNSNLGAGTSFLNLWTKKISADFWPVTYSSLWLIKYFFGNEPFAYHLINLIFYSVNCLLLLYLLNTFKIKGALLIVLIFAVHPMNVSVATWAFQLKTNLANFFALLSCIFFLKNSDKPSFLCYLMSIVFFVLSCLSKISVIMLPFYFLIYLHVKKETKNKLSVYKLIPFFILALAIGLVNLTWDSNAIPSPKSELVLDTNIIFRFLLVGQNFLFYLKQSFLPVNLMFVHPRINPDINSVISYFPFAILSLVIFYSLLAIYKKTTSYLYIYLSIIFSFLFLMPTLGLAEIYFMRFSYVAEHYLTFAMIGFIYPVVKILGNKKYGNWLVIVFTIGLFLTSADYINFYASEKIVMNHSLSKNPDSFLPHNILGLAYKNENNLDIAIYHFNKSNVINPNAASYYNIASINEKNNDLNNAVINYKKSIDLNPYVANTYNNLAIIYSKLKNKTEAINHFKQALKTDPGDIRFYYNIGFAHEENNELELAIAWYQRALVLQPTNELIQKSLNRIVKK